MALEKNGLNGKPTVDIYEDLNQLQICITLLHPATCPTNLICNSNLVLGAGKKRYTCNSKKLQAWESFTIGNCPETLVYHISLLEGGSLHSFV